jgi:hypothetical protein
MDVSSSPVANSMARRSLSQGHPASIAPSFMTMPRMPALNFTPSTMQSPMPSEQPAHSGFHSNMSGDLHDFSGPSFVNNALGTGDNQWHMDFDNTDPNFYGSHAAPNLDSAGFVIPRSPLDELDPSLESSRNLTDLHSFDQYQNPGNLRYNGTQP